jgi:hypothetical protein
VTSDCLGGGKVATKSQISHEGSDRYGEHDPAIVRHEQQPGGVRTEDEVVLQDSHDEEAVEDLNGIQSGLDESASAFDIDLPLVPCGEQ